MAWGREFLPEEEVIGTADVGIITDGFWHSHFAAISMKTLTMDGRTRDNRRILRPVSVSAQYRGADVWLPRISDPDFLETEQVRTGAGS